MPRTAPTAVLAVALAGLLAAGSLAAGCGGTRKTSWSEVRPPEAYVEVLPPAAAVSVDGIEVGQGALSFPIRDAQRAYAVRVASPGFVPFAATLPGAKLAGQKLEVVLRPEGFGSERRLEAGEPVGLLQAASVLLRAGRPREALTYAEASIRAGDTAPAHRVLGDCYLRLGNRNQAIQEWSVYLLQSPTAPDRAAVELAIAAARRDIPMSPARPAGN